MCVLGGVAAGVVLAVLPAGPAVADSAALRPDAAVLVATHAVDGGYGRDVLTAVLPDGTIDP